MLLHGFLPSLLEGSAITLAVALSSLAIAALLGLAGALAGGMVFSDKMKGVDSPDCKGCYNRYSYEFYHGK